MAGENNLPVLPRPFFENVSNLNAKPRLRAPRNDTG